MQLITAKQQHPTWQIASCQHPAITLAVVCGGKNGKNVVRLLSLWDGNFSGFMLNFGGGISLYLFAFPTMSNMGSNTFCNNSDHKTLRKSEKKNWIPNP